MSKFDMDYYLKHHIPSTKSAWGPFGNTSCIVCDIEDGGEYAVSVVTFWKDSASWEWAKGGESAQKLAADVQNFTHVDPVMVAGKVLN
jgi:hypothetical protein